MILFKTFIKLLNVFLLPSYLLLLPMLFRRIPHGFGARKGAKVLNFLVY